MTKELVEIDHVKEAKDNFLGQYKNSVNFCSFVNCFLEPINELESEITKFQNMLPLKSAEGVNLDYWYEILDLSMISADTEEKRANAYTFIGAYNSEGTCQDVMTLISNLLDAEAVKFFDGNDGTFYVEVYNPAKQIDTTLITNAVNLAKPVGITFYFIVLINTDEGLFFAHSDDTSAGATGFAVLQTEGDRADDAPINGGGNYATLYMTGV